MKSDILSGSIFRMPLQVHYKGKDHNGEIIGKVSPGIKYFTCRFPDSDMLIIEAIKHNGKQNYEWIAHSIGHEFGYLIPLIGKEIEKHLDYGKPD